jgi:hypothetical protein
MTSNLLWQHLTFYTSEVRRDIAFTALFHAVGSWCPLVVQDSLI